MITFENSKLITVISRLATPTQRKTFGLPGVDDRFTVPDADLAAALSEFRNLVCCERRIDDLRKMREGAESCRKVFADLMQGIMTPLETETLMTITFPEIGRCLVPGCGMAVFETPSGTCCRNGHGGAPVEKMR